MEDFKYIILVLVLMLITFFGCSQIEEAEIIVDEWPTSEVKTGCPQIQDQLKAVYEYNVVEPGTGFSWWVFDYPSIGYFPKCDFKFFETDEKMAQFEFVYLFPGDSLEENRVGNVHYLAEDITLVDTCYSVRFTQVHDNWNGIDEEGVKCTNNGIYGDWRIFAKTDTIFYPNILERKFYLYGGN